MVLTHAEWLVERFERHLLRPHTPYGDCWHYVALPLEKAVSLLERVYAACQAIWPKHRPRFLEAGCGLGTKVLLAERIGYEASGVEIHPGYVATARQLVSPHQIHEADLRTFDRYDQFDVIYSYTPMRTPAGNRLILEQMLDGMADGAILLLCSCEGARWPAIHRDGVHYVWDADWCSISVKTTDAGLVEKLKGLLA